MTCSGNNVCFNCRQNVRRGTFRMVSSVQPERIGRKGLVKCPGCGETTYFLGPDIEVPPKNKIKAWKKLYEECIRFSTCIESANSEAQVKKTHALEREISELKCRSENKERNKLILQMTKRLKDT